jgi:hypothetical protein
MVTCPGGGVEATIPEHQEEALAYLGWRKSRFSEVAGK